MRRRGWKALELRRLLVNLKSGEAIAGLVKSEDARVLVLVDATLHARGESPVALDGEAIIDLDNVAFAQALPPKVLGPGPEG